jgi:hypothetical protein
MSFGYTGFGMKKDVYDRKLRQPFAHRKELLRDEGQTITDNDKVHHEIPKESIIRPETSSQRFGRYARLVLALIGIAVLAATVYAMLTRIH